MKERPWERAPAARTLLGSEIDRRLQADAALNDLVACRYASLQGLQQQAIPRRGRNGSGNGSGASQGGLECGGQRLRFHRLLSGWCAIGGCGRIFRKGAAAVNEDARC